MKLSVAALLMILGQSHAELPSGECGSDPLMAEIPSTDGYSSLTINGFKPMIHYMASSTASGKIVLKDFGAAFTTSGADGVIKVTAGETCGVTADVGGGGKTPDSSALSILGLSTFAMGYPLISAGALLMNEFSSACAADTTGDCDLPMVTVEIHTPETRKPPAATNPCDGKKIELDNAACFAADGTVPGGPQAGANVTKGYVGGLEDTSVGPIMEPYFTTDLCPVNVHWHLGAEHLSVGEYDSTGTGPSDIANRRFLAGEVREGNLCKHYDENDPKFTTPYQWKYCQDMEVGQTYEVHWPHSKAGACGTPNQYQYPFYDGVFCRAEKLDLSKLPQQVGVQAQVFTVVNDEDYYYPDLFRGMLVDGEMGKDMAIYTGSTTGTSRDNEICSSYSPITWQVDRKCHMISASSFDKMCADQLSQRDDMTDDTYPHGSREVVADPLAANNLKDTSHSQTTP
mmetsp:Transcript_3235/g.4885  ORF Transcript_3235/g.4885 Transcript_3235/m.4885 type:complete len:457 (+) Transcript_3235:101-1471(+)